MSQILYNTFIGITIFSIIAFIYILIILFHVFRLPKNNPKQYLKKKKQIEDKGKKIVIFIGDSLTHGTIGENYTKIVSDRLKSEKFEFINAGINSELTFNVLKRMDDIIQCKPDFATILIGTNDVNGSISPENAKIYERKKDFPKEPNFWKEERFKEDLNSIVKRLKQETNARIAILSIPPLGENSTALPFKRSISYCAIIKKIAKQCDITYLPLNEKMVAFIKENPINSSLPFEKLIKNMLKVIFAHYFGRSWNKISKTNGLRLLIDNVHLNSIGAAMVADLIEEFLEN
ncbi:MAG: SGNH/GDSL hydrolase family protein [Promethearchaeota archaeon]